jgi:hypothetical protein
MNSELHQIIRAYKPKITDSTIKSYLSNLRSISKKLGCSDIEPSCFTGRQDDVLALLDGESPKTRKTKLASIVVFLEASKAPQQIVEKYRAMMLSDSEASKADDEKQEMSDKQKREMKPWEHFRLVAENNLKKYKKLLVQPLETVTDDEKQNLINLMISLIYSEIPPRRLLDYQNFKIGGDINKETDNYWDKRKKQFVFNDYKTRATYGTQRVDIPAFLNTILAKYQKIIGDFLLGENGMSKTLLNRRLQKVFNGASVNTLRHSFITSVVLKDMPRIAELKKVASEMGHSLEEQMLYKKFDQDE